MRSLIENLGRYMRSLIENLERYMRSLIENLLTINKTILKITALEMFRALELQLNDVLDNLEQILKQTSNPLAIQD